MKVERMDVSERRVCVVLGVSRSVVRQRDEVAVRRSPVVDEVLAARLERLIERFPTYGYRRLWAMLRFGEGLKLNRKAVYRVLKLKGWFVSQGAARLQPTRKNRPTTRSSSRSTPA